MTRGIHLKYLNGGDLARLGLPEEASADAATAANPGLSRDGRATDPPLPPAFVRQMREELEDMLGLLGGGAGPSPHTDRSR